MTARRLVFVEPGSVAVRREAVPDPGPGEVLVRTRTSAISAGTEGLLYRGEAPSTLRADPNIDAIDGDLSYPIAYGYAAVGRVAAVGEGVPADWLDRRVFAYNPHESHFVADPDVLVPVPDAVSTRAAALFPTLETAVTFVLDGEPLLGERVAVFGQGVVGLVTTALLGRSPVGALVTFDRYERRRELSERFGADAAFEAGRRESGGATDPTSPNRPETEPRDRREPTEAFRLVADGRADLTYELSGSPAALDDAIATTGFDGRVVVGSWYGTKPASLSLGGRFHRSRIDVRSSQVSTLAPRHGGRWSRDRRRDVTWEWLERLDLEPLFTHEFDVDDAADAYRLLEERPDEAVQVLLTYD